MPAQTATAQRLKARLLDDESRDRSIMLQMMQLRGGFKPHQRALLQLHGKLFKVCK